VEALTQRCYERHRRSSTVTSGFLLARWADASRHAGRMRKAPLARAGPLLFARANSDESSRRRGTVLLRFAALARLALRSKLELEPTATTWAAWSAVAAGAPIAHATRPAITVARALPVSAQSKGGSFATLAESGPIPSGASRASRSSLAARAEGHPIS